MTKIKDNTRLIILIDLLAELDRQDTLHGERNKRHTYDTLMTALVEEVGELARELEEGRDLHLYRSNLYIEAVQVAAMGVRFAIKYREEITKQWPT